MKRAFLTLLTAISLFPPNCLLAREIDDTPNISIQGIARKSFPVPTALSDEVIEELTTYQSIVIEGIEYELIPYDENTLFALYYNRPFSSFFSLHDDQIGFHWMRSYAQQLKNPLWNPLQPHEHSEFIEDFCMLPESLMLTKKAPFPYSFRE